MNPSPCFFFLETGWKRDGKFLLWRGESFVSRRVAYARRGSESGGERSFITLGSPVGKRAERFLLLACIVGKVILDFRELCRRVPRIGSWTFSRFGTPTTIVGKSAHLLKSVGIERFL